MLTLLNRHVFSPLIARKNGSRVFEFLRILEASQFDSPEVVRHRQWRKLKQIIRHAYDTVPFYRNRFDAMDLHPDDLRDFSDLDAIPILTKSDIRNYNSELISTHYNRDTLRVKTTSGSTGVPLAIRIDEPSMQWKSACTIRSDQWSGWRFGERVAKVWGNPEYLHEGWKGKIRNRLIERAIYLDTLGITDERMHRFCQDLKKWPPSLLFGHAHSLYLLACYAHKHKIDWIRPKGMISTAMLLHDYQRATIEKVFGTKVTNRYGCEETSLIASECPEHDGLHFNMDSIYPQIAVDPAASATNGAPTGKLLLTDLTNQAMPLIRYQVGDVVVAKESPCGCGRGLQMIQRIEGREADYVLTPTGKLISGISLTENFAMLIRGAAQVQLVQESLTLLRVRLVTSDEFNDQSVRDIHELVRTTFGPAMRHEIERLDAIPQEPSGKYRFCISKVATDHLRAMSA
ncbi:phenylacetate--CoA ligase family protein [Tuwongella immobilis]|uniref:Capk related-protein: CapK related-protein n=1 Tax=Tuwongella immobilis TaxID=692036 RepID=A0A6C2YTA5_9BACT|nr:phenylacetate--CoA ligase family protein [Tuwongella immobilis]VIP04353.1 capk related-protein : CapK related-protein OS=Desulfovibrio sp. X2 GN=dsx2_1185 PE=4 SV=1 [Tuwongella immobilis]VTS06068.1 capk related-protein : CapK related-protein OS=Desulfovibrio sp. X2 GN=dsx2_1185 PE=4 SV=1 [Tuwongella immobilis]